jgi:hypothetical protein
MTDVPPILRAELAAAFPNSPRLQRTFEDLFVALVEAKETAEAAASSDLHDAPVLLVAADDGFSAGSILTAGEGIAFTAGEGTLTIAVDGTLPDIDGGHAVTFIATADTNLILPVVGQLATIQDVATVTSGLTAADITFAPAGGLSATDVQAALAELDSEKLTTVNNSNWSGADLEITNGGTGASSAAAARSNLSIIASNIPSVATGDVAATDVQAAIAELASEKLAASAIGSTVQAYDAKLAAISGLTPAADQIIYWTGASAAAMTGLTSVARTLISQTTQALMRTTGLGLGTAATQNTGTSGGNVPLLNAANTWSGKQTFAPSAAHAFEISGDRSVAAWNTNGVNLRVIANTVTNSSSAGGSTIGKQASNAFAIPAFASTNAITVTNAVNVFIEGAPTAGANTTITNAWPLWVDAGHMNMQAGDYYRGGTKVVGARATGWGAATGTATRTAIATYAAPTISNPPTQAEVQAIADALQAWSRRSKATGDDLTTHGLFGT